jgi:serine/threonine protein kinase
MSVQPSGRRTESLFDNRYRYDYIYPRGRSGETLRAYDTLDEDRPVVIKRPAPQDAPPMRAGQEVSIRNEKQALERLSGHPVLAELRGSGTFRAGGQTHEYIVMDLAHGQIVENMVLEMAEQGQYLPELETLVIIDSLLDLLAYAHEKLVIYNDVDAKHLFWDRDAYHLTVIDWGNAVFPDEPGALPSVTRASDIYQVGELLYFILTGGNRLSVVADDGDSFFVNFGSDAEHIPAKLQTILTRAVHPDLKRRYATIRDLRYALDEYRQPLEKARDEIISRVRKRVRPTASQEELEELREMLDAALAMDPGYPETRKTADEIGFFLRQIRIQADLDAIRIYIESGNWPRAHSLLHDLLPGADPVNQPLIKFLIAATALLENTHLTPPPAGFFSALDPLFQGDVQAAGRLLLTADETRGVARKAQWLLAEQLALHIPEVILLRPHIVRLRSDLENLSDARPALEWLDEIDSELSRAPVPGLTGLKVIYQQVNTLLGPLEVALEALPEPEALLACVIRARRAAQDIVGRLDEVGRCVYQEPSRAAALLQQASMVDPTSPHFAALHDYFDEVHQAIQALGQFRPRSDGTNLATWFVDVQEFIRPYLDDLPDQQLHAAADAVQKAAEGWTTIVNYLALGRRQPTIQAIRDTAETIRPFNESIAAWLGTIANRLPDAAYAEQLSPNEALAAVLIDGWKAWDRGDSIHAAQLGQQAHELAHTDGERLAANRLRRLGELVDSWQAEHGPQNIERTDRAETEAIAILLTDEERERRTFAEQMPNTTTYLRAMNRGIVAYMHQSSSAGWRALYMHYVLRGMLSLLDDNLDEAEFWRNVAEKSFENARTHRIFQVLDRALTGRRLVQNAQRAMNAVNGPGDLEAVRQALNAPLAGELLSGAEQGVLNTNDALRHWSDGDFYAARQALDTALDEISHAVDLADLDIEHFMAWLTELRDTAAELHQVRLTIEQGATTTREEPDPALAEAHDQIVTATLRTLGPDFVHQVRQWDDMYRAVLETYTTQRLNRREKLAAFSRHFASLFITRHPAYPLFRHWESVIEQLPPDEIEEDLISLETPADAGADSLAYLEDNREPEPPAPRAERDGGDLPWNWIIGGALVLLIAAIGFGILRNRGGDKNEPPPNPGADSTEVLVPPSLEPSLTPEAVVVVPTRALPTRTPTEALPTLSPVPSMAFPSAAPTEFVPTATPTDSGPPTLTPTMFVTSTLIPSATPESVVAQPTASASPDVLAALAALPAGALPGPEGALTPGEDGKWLLSAAAGGLGPLSVEFTPALLSEMFQPGAASTFRRADATLGLVSYDQASLDRGEVAFGLGVENAAGQNTIGQVEFVSTNFVSVGLNQNGQFRSPTQFPQQNLQMTLSIRRTDTNTLSFYVDDKLLGESVYIFPQGEPITLILYVTGRDVVVELSAFEMDFSPRDELP